MVKWALPVEMATRWSTPSWSMMSTMTKRMVTHTRLVWLLLSSIWCRTCPKVRWRAWVATESMPSCVIGHTITPWTQASNPHLIDRPPRRSWSRLEELLRRAISNSLVSACQRSTVQQGGPTSTCHLRSWNRSNWRAFYSKSVSCRHKFKNSPKQRANTTLTPTLRLERTQPTLTLLRTRTKAKGRWRSSRKHRLYSTR